MNTEKHLGLLSQDYLHTCNQILREEIAGLLAETHTGNAEEFLVPRDKKPYVIMVVGVNGVGKTTTIGKLAHQFKNQGLKVVLGAGDTFQAALITWLTEQELDSVEGVQALSREQIDAMLRFAVRAAALTCSKTGPDLPYRHQLT